MINAIIDISHYNKVTSFAKVQKAGVFGIIHKATQSTNYKDPTFYI
jgi:GH25 family lysozyme M1 (1,4-beta-N-acetylmuramidase)